MCLKRWPPLRSEGTPGWSHPSSHFVTLFYHPTLLLVLILSVTCLNFRSPRREPGCSLYRCHASTKTKTPIRWRCSCPEEVSRKNFKIFPGTTCLLDYGETDGRSFCRWSLRGRRRKNFCLSGNTKLNGDTEILFLVKSNGTLLNYRIQTLREN